MGGDERTVIWLRKRRRGDGIGHTENWGCSLTNCSAFSGAATQRGIWFKVLLPIPSFAPSEEICNSKTSPGMRVNQDFLGAATKARDSRVSPAAKVVMVLMDGC